MPTRERRIRSGRSPSSSATSSNTASNPPGVKPQGRAASEMVRTIKRGSDASANAEAGSSRTARAWPPRDSASRPVNAEGEFENLKRGARPQASRGRPHTLCDGVTGEPAGPVVTGPPRSALSRPIGSVRQGGRGRRRRGAGEGPCDAAGVEREERVMRSPATTDSKGGPSQQGRRRKRDSVRVTTGRECRSAGTSGRTGR